MSRADKRNLLHSAVYSETLTGVLTTVENSSFSANRVNQRSGEWTIPCLSAFTRETRYEKFFFFLKFADRSWTHSHTIRAPTAFGSFGFFFFPWRLESTGDYLLLPSSPPISPAVQKRVYYSTVFSISITLYGHYYDPPARITTHAEIRWQGFSPGPRHPPPIPTHRIRKNALINSRGPVGARYYDPRPRVSARACDRYTTRYKIVGGDRGVHGSLDNPRGYIVRCGNARGRRAAAAAAAAVPAGFAGEFIADKFGLDRQRSWHGARFGCQQKYKSFIKDKEPPSQNFTLLSNYHRSGIYLRK